MDREIHLFHSLLVWATPRTKMRFLYTVQYAALHAQLSAQAHTLLLELMHNAHAEPTTAGAHVRGMQKMVSFNVCCVKPHDLPWTWREKNDRLVSMHTSVDCGDIL